MITAIVNQHDNTDRSAIARSLAVLRARSGRRVCLMDTGTPSGDDWSAARSAAHIVPWIDTRSVGSRAVKARLSTLRPLFNDILIDGGARDSDACRCVLACARLIVVPVRGHAIDLDRQYRLLARLNAARPLNPGLQVLFVAVSSAAMLDPDERAAVLAHVARVDGARLADTVLQIAPGKAGDGLCAVDADAGDPAGAAGMKALYGEVYAPAPRLTVPPQLQVGAAHALYR